MNTERRPLTRAGRIARGALLIVAAIAATSVLASLVQLLLQLRAGNSDPLPAPSAGVVEGTRVFLSAAFLLAFIAAAIAFVRWERDAYDRAADFLGTEMPYAKPWTIWGWFVPIWFLWVPYRIIKSVWTAVCPGSSSILVWWWSSWVAMHVLGRMSNNLYRWEVEVMGLSTPVVAGLLGLGGEIATVIGAVLAAAVIAQIDRASSGIGQHYPMTDPLRAQSIQPGA